MKIQLISDAHLEHRRDRGYGFFRDISRKPRADVVVVAGDFATMSDLEHGLRVLCQVYEHVVYVTGNHEFYGSDRETIRLLLGGIPDKNFHWLDRSAVTIEGQRFIGCPLWFPSDPMNQLYEHGWSDFRHIKAFATWVYQDNADDVAFLRKEVGPNDIVVTHYLPSRKSVSPRFHNDPYNCFFVCPMDDVIQTAQPKLWLHGHTHDSKDYQIGQTRVLCNPYGYLGVNLNPGFNYGLVVEV